MELTPEDHRLVNVTVRSAFRKNRSNYLRLGYELDDLIQIGYVALYKAIEKHDPSKAPLHYLKRIYIRGYMLNTLNRNRIRSVSLDKMDDDSQFHLGWSERIEDPNAMDGFDPEISEIEARAQELSKLVVELSKTDDDIRSLELIYLRQMSYREAAEYENVSMAEMKSRRERGKKKLLRWPHRCEMCAADISHRTAKAHYCSDCVRVREKQRMKEYRAKRANQPRGNIELNQ